MRQVTNAAINPHVQIKAMRANVLETLGLHEKASIGTRRCGSCRGARRSSLFLVHWKERKLIRLDVKALGVGVPGKDGKSKLHERKLRSALAVLRIALVDRIHDTRTWGAAHVAPLARVFCVQKSHQRTIHTRTRGTRRRPFPCLLLQTRSRAARARDERASRHRARRDPGLPAEESTTKHTTLADSMYQLDVEIHMVVFEVRYEKKKRPFHQTVAIVLKSGVVFQESLYFQCVLPTTMRSKYAKVHANLLQPRLKPFNL
ncbi:hypothetical protein PsorP6_014881 [Peronosclerospora sorghi]|uniref:Uncharacterized protein n=1 Tax=Peronosclerospora sorghi TaxID=230839 RepID=A0ACC0VT37_9STRA|nr:hypothetical protein PsorP6_014881 [Peronosclerospora sorghi]